MLCSALLPEQDLLAARERFFEAMEEGDLQAASRLVEEHGKQGLVNGPLQDQRWPLSAAIEAGREESVRWLLEHGAWLSHVKYPWAEAAESEGLCEVVNEMPSDDEAQPGDIELLLACEHGQLGIVQHLMKQRTKQDSVGSVTPLIVAAQYGHLSVVRYLLQVNHELLILCVLATRLARIWDADHLSCPGDGDRDRWPSSVAGSRRH